MAATSQQMVMSQDQTMKEAIASIASLSSNGHASKRSNSISNNNNVMQSPARSGKERRPSFTITLPPSSSKNSFLSARSIEEEENDPAGLTACHTSSSNNSIKNSRGSSARRPSVHFNPGEEDILLSHEAKHGLPKTPYPVTGEEDERIQNSLFKR
ncbi:hypothetical protein BGX34_002355 [Mortierella sp. NVP85]|nr:hypothetical protein BGX34_002355 [Mortierella sp. NVP85]